MNNSVLESRIKELMVEFELRDKKHQIVATYSKGMKQKLAIIRAVIHDPKYVFMDEPLSGLDPEASQFVKDYMLSLKEKGKTVILSTHDLNDADKLNDRVAVIKNQLLVVNSPKALKIKSFRGVLYSI